MNIFGRIFRLTTFGESHGEAIGGVIDGCPSGVRIDLEQVQQALERRKGKSAVSTPRTESDQPQFLSGLFEGVTTGAPLAFIIPNTQQRSGDYDPLRDLYRPSHADYTYQAKYGIRDHRGGGRASARETVVRVVAGAIAQQLLRAQGIALVAYTTQIGAVALDTQYQEGVTLDTLQGRFVGCPDPALDATMYEHLLALRAEGDSTGGVVALHITGVPAGVGSPLYAKLSAQLAGAMMSIGAAKGVEIGDGFALASMRGSDANDSMMSDRGYIRMCTNHSGGIQGGISNGAEIRLRVAFKPIASIAKPQRTVSGTGENIEVVIAGRHDACVIPRVLPVVEAMGALVLLDELLIGNMYR